MIEDYTKVLLSKSYHHVAAMIVVLIVPLVSRITLGMREHLHNVSSARLFDLDDRKSPSFLSFFWSSPGIVVLPATTICKGKQLA